LFDTLIVNSGGYDDALIVGVNSFTLSQLVELSGWEFNKIRRAGIVLGVSIAWNCDLDDTAEACMPTMRFLRMDDPTSKLSSGYNFRLARYLDSMGNTRTLTKFYGVRVVFIVSGVASKFDDGALFSSVGAGIGLLSLATVLADLLAEKLLPSRKTFTRAKYSTCSGIPGPKDADEVEEHAELSQVAEASRWFPLLDRSRSQRL
jgi:hypothetical protein